MAGQKHSLCTPSQGLSGWPGRQEQHKQSAPTKGHEQHQFVPLLCHESRADDRNLLFLVSACTHKSMALLLGKLLSGGPRCWSPSPATARGTLCPEGLATEMALEGLLASVRAQVHVEVGFLCEGVVAKLTHIGPLIPVGRETSPSPLPASAPRVSA